MSVRCFALSEPQTPSSNLGQEDELLLNGQHQLHRGEDGLNSGQHHHKEGKVQACHGDLLHYQGKEHNISGLLHHHQRKDQDCPGGRLFQQRHHHHLFSESHLPKTQDALDERGPSRGVGGQNVTRKKKKEAPSQRTFGHHYSICTRPVPTESQNWIKFTFGPLTCFLVMPDLSRKQSWHNQQDQMTQADSSLAAALCNTSQCCCLSAWTVGETSCPVLDLHKQPRLKKCMCFDKY